MERDPGSDSEAKAVAETDEGGGVMAFVKARRSPRASSREGWKTAFSGSLENTFTDLMGEERNVA